MSSQDDDRFVREVNEELRREQMQGLWKRFGPLVIGGAVAIVLITGGFQFWKYYSEGQAAANGDQFNAALALLDEGKTDEGISALDVIIKEGTPSYAAMARLRLANAKSSGDNTDEALAEFKAIAADSAVPDFVRDIAQLRAGQLMVDIAGYDEVVAQLQTLATDSNAFRFSSREAMGLSAYKAGDFKEARSRMDSLVNDPQTPRAMAQRANIILELITSSGKLAE